MQLRLLGTAAAEGYPGLFCDCHNCRAARLLGGKNLRYRTAALVNDDLLIDFGPDLVAASHRFGISFAKISQVLITHFHEDHWQPDNLLYHHPWFRGTDAPLLNLYGGPRLTAEVEAECKLHNQLCEDFAIAPHVVRPFEEFSAGPYQVKSFAANHSAHTDPLLYAVSREGRRLLYATDTGPLPEESWAALAGLQAHLIALEFTMGGESHTHHLGRADFLATIARMRREAVLAPEGRIVAFHFAHHFTPAHEQLEKELAAQQVIAGFDGLTINI